GGGNIFDHYHVAYEYPGNVWCHLASRKTPQCFNENADFVRGTEGTLVIGKGPTPYIEDNSGKRVWSYRVPRDGEASMYQVEHDDLFASIRSGEFINDGDRMIHSSMMAIMGRMSAQTGQTMTWEEAVNANEDLYVDEGKMTWNESYKPHPVPTPGVTKIDGIA
ncbi:MAG: gfo/Idh/MocA family oxidoreductase, partial [Planctomycetota bacterium]